MSEEAQVADTTTDAEAVELPKLTYEELEAELAKTRREAAGRRVINKDKDAELEEYRSWKKSQMSEVDRLKSEKAEVEAEMKAIRRENLQHKVAEKAGLDPELASRLRGDSEEEMLADAKALAAKLPKPTTPTASGLLAGKRGKPVGTEASKSSGDWLMDMLRDPK